MWQYACTDGRTGEDGIVDCPDLLQVATAARSDQPHRAEALVRRAHDLAEGGRDGRIVEILEDHHGWTRQAGKAVNLLLQAAVGVATRGRGIAAERRRAGKAHHRRQVGKVAADPRVHVAAIARADVEQLDHVANRGGVELAELVEGGRGDEHDPVLSDGLAKKKPGR